MENRKIKIMQFEILLNPTSLVWLVFWMKNVMIEVIKSKICQGFVHKFSS
ncbi:MAG: hypothetical protein GF317_05115 [Candidatus Lokiarchaeota archaeon]|nr:hypothetical protein [Candidatus Lokiarchaeota archaeon]MBD3199186.1 hypothetical protein [Candidatus Lokiarchaeota archaeon]